MTKLACCSCPTPLPCTTRFSPIARGWRLPSTLLAAAVLWLSLPFESSAFTRLVVSSSQYGYILRGGPSPVLTNLVAVAAGGAHTVALKADGTVVAWGQNYYGQTNVPPGLTNVIQISAANAKSLALKNDGGVVAWGSDAAPNLSNVVAVSAGMLRSLALRADGTVVAWGTSPYNVEVPSGLSNVIAIAAGETCGLALQSNGRVVGWGMLGGQTNMPPADLTNAMAVAAGRTQALAVRSNGTVVAWGEASPQQSVPADLANVKTIAARDETVVAVLCNGTVVSWDRNQPGGFSGSDLTDVVAVAAADAGFLAVLNPSRWPVIIVQPTNQNVLLGATVTLSVAALSDSPVSYEWCRWGSYIPGETRSTLVLPDVQLQQDGQYYAIVRNAFGSDISADAYVQVTSPEVKLSGTNYTVIENEAVARVTVTRTPGCLAISSVDFATGNGTAVAGVDYASTNGTLVFGSGETIKELEIRILDNSIVQGDRTLNLTLSNPTRAVLGSASATLTIVDDDSSFKLSRSNYSVLERLGVARINVVRQGNLTQSASVEYLTFPGSATPGLDYTPVAGSLIFAPSQTSQTIEIPLQTDAIAEGDETFLVALTNPIGPAVLTSPSEAVVNIAEGPENTLSSADEVALGGLIAQGGSITVAVDGTIALSRTLTVTNDTILDGSGHDVTLNGMDAVRVFYVGPDVSLFLSNLTVASGLSDRGGGLCNVGGFVTMVGCKFVNNQARGTNGTSTGPGGFAAGGAVYSEGDLWITNCEFSANIGRGGNGADDPATGGPAGNCEGGAIYSLGSVWITASRFLTNQIFGGNGGNATNSALGQGGVAGNSRGGVLSGSGPVTVDSSRFEYNVAAGGIGGSANGTYAGGAGGGTGEAGAVYNSDTLVLSNCVFSFNRVFGGGSGYGYYSGRGGAARAGSVFNGGVLIVNPNCLFAFNEAKAGVKAGFKHIMDGSAFGGGLFNEGTLSITDAVIVSNKAYYGEAAGGGIYSASGSLGITSSVFTCNASLSGTAGDWYYGGTGFDSFGGAVFNAATASFSNCSFTSNSVVGGYATLASFGYPGMFPSGSGYGGGIGSRGSTEVLGCSFVANSALGAPGVPGLAAVTAAGGSAAGGAFAASAGTVKVLNTTVSGCSAIGAAGGSAATNLALWFDGGPGGSAYGGGIFATNAAVAMTNCTVAGNTVAPGQGGPGGPQGRTGAPGAASWGGIVLQTDAVLHLQNTIVTANVAGDVSGSFSGNHNLIGKDARLGAPTINTLGTICLPLMPDSPAIDAALTVPGIDADQRGVARPYGSAPDIGAYEWNGTDFYTQFVLISLTSDNSALHLKGGGPVNQDFRIQVSNDLANWSEVGSMSSGPKGLFEFLESLKPYESRRFYRIVAP